MQKRPSIGPRLDERLVFIHEKVAEIRNSIGHSALFKSPDDPQRILFSSVGRIPFQSFGYEGVSIAPTEISFIALEAHGDWLNSLQADFLKLLNHCKTAKVFEIDHPRSLEPSVLQERIRLEDERAKDHSHDGKHLG